MFIALIDPTGVIRATARRAGTRPLGAGRLAHRQARLAEVETRMVEVLDELGLTDYVTSIPGVSAVGAAAILAETGDPTRFDSPRALVKHAGLCPRENTSGTYSGRSRISRRGRPRLRLAAWRAVWGALAQQPVMAARYRHLTTRQAQSAQRRSGPSGDRRRAAALDPRHRHPPRELGCRHRRR